MQPGNAFAQYRPEEQGYAMPPAPGLDPRASRPVVRGGMAPGNAFAQAPAPAPMQQQPQPTQGGSNAFADGVKRFARGVIGGERADQIDAQRKAKMQEGVKASLLFMQHAAQMPEEQRAQFFARKAPEIMAAGGRDPRQANGRYDDATLNQGIAALSAQLGIGPEKPKYQFHNMGDGGIGRSDEGGQFEVVNQPRVEPPKPATPPPLNNGMEWDGTKWVENPAAIAAYRKMHPGGSGSAKEGRILTPDELKKAGFEPGSVVEYDPNSGYDVLQRPRQAPEYDPVTTRKLKGSVRGLDLLNQAITDYKQTLEDEGGVQTIEGPWNKENASKVSSARNNVLVLAKELFELGALVGADFSIIESAVKPATGWPSLGQNKGSLKAALSPVESLIHSKMSQIPQEFVDSVRSGYTSQVGGVGGPQKPAAPPPGVARSATGWTGNPMISGAAAPQQQAQDDIHPEIARLIDDGFGPDEEDGEGAEQTVSAGQHVWAPDGREFIVNAGGSMVPVEQ